MGHIFWVRILAAVFILSCQGRVLAMDEDVEKLLVTSNAFKDGEMIPKKYSGYGDDVSPDIIWSKPPIGTKGFAVICEDIDAAIGIWTHWVMFNIPRKTEALPEGMPRHEVFPDGTIQGVNDFKRIGYDGPRPPFGTHRYYFKVYALDTYPLKIGGNITKDELFKAMKGNVLAEGSIMGRYSK